VANKIQLIIEADDQASSKFKKIVAGLEKGLSSTDTETKKLTRSTSELGSTLKWAGALLGTYFGVRAIRGIGDALLDTGLKTDRFAAGLKGALGTVEAAGEAMDWLRDVSDELGLVFENQVGAFQKLAAAARGTALEGQGARDIFLAVSEAATAMQLSADETNGALYAISQMMSKVKDFLVPSRLQPGLWASPLKNLTRCSSRVRSSLKISCLNSHGNCTRN